MRRLLTLALTALLSVSLTGCLGTLVQAPTPVDRAKITTRAHLLAAPTQIEAHNCTKGLGEVFTFVPLWGVVVGVLTLGIVVPMTTSYACVTGDAPAAQVN